MGQWHRGRTVLLGDAGYCGSPLAGLGTAMALVADARAHRQAIQKADAITLADC